MLSSHRAHEGRPSGVSSSSGWPLISRCSVVTRWRCALTAQRANGLPARGRPVGWAMSDPATPSGRRPGRSRMGCRSWSTRARERPTLRGHQQVGPAGDRGAEPRSGDDPLDHERAERRRVATPAEAEEFLTRFRGLGGRQGRTRSGRSRRTRRRAPGLRAGRPAAGGARLGRDRIRPAPAGPRARLVMSTAVRLVRDYAFDVLGCPRCAGGRRRATGVPGGSRPPPGSSSTARCAGCWTSAAAARRLGGHDRPRTTRVGPRRGLPPVLVGTGGAAAVRAR